MGGIRPWMLLARTQELLPQNVPETKKQFRFLGSQICSKPETGCQSMSAVERSRVYSPHRVGMLAFGQARARKPVEKRFCETEAALSDLRSGMISEKLLLWLRSSRIADGY